MQACAIVALRGVAGVNRNAYDCIVFAYIVFAHIYRAVIVVIAIFWHGNTSEQRVADFYRAGIRILRAGDCSMETFAYGAEISCAEIVVIAIKRIVLTDAQRVAEIICTRV